MRTDVRRIGKYELHTRLGHSTTAQVWKAFDSQLQRPVTIKFFHAHLQHDPELLQRFVHQAQALAALHHPNVVQLYETHVFPSSQLDTSTSLVAIVTEYVEGETLADYITSTPSTGKLPPGADIVRLLAPLSLALDSAHQHGIIHGNIKPTNILLDKSTSATTDRIGEPMLIDFGLTKLLRNHNDSSTAFYLSPEQIQGSPANERSDIYALGVILYEIYTGMPPFRGNRPVAIMMQHVNALPTPPSHINPTISSALSNVLLRSLAKEPANRFPSASSMTGALANALNIPLPENLRQSSHLLDETQTPVFDTPLTPSSSGTSREHDFSLFGQHSQNSWPGIPGTPPESISTTVPAANTARDQSTSSLQSSSGVAPSMISPSSPLRRRSHKDVQSVWVVIVIMFLLLASLGTLLFLTQRRDVTTSQVVGQVSFVSSGQGNENSSQEINDELEIDLAHIPAPAQGKSYYAWLLEDSSQTEATPILLGQMQVKQGNIHFRYPGDGQHTNLLGVVSRFLITEDPTNSPSSNPLLDSSTWRYYGEIPQAPSPLDTLHFSMLDHLRHLLVESPELKIRGLHGGLGIWFLKNTSMIVDEANGARDDWQRKNAPSLHNQIVQILDYIDGKAFVQTDVPAGTPLLADAHSTQIAVLGPSPHDPDPPGYSYNNEVPPGYVYLIAMHMNGAILSPRSTSDQRKLAIQISTALNEVKQELEQVRQDAKQLVTMTNAQLVAPASLSLTEDMLKQAQYAYSGQSGPSTKPAQGGAVWIYDHLQRLATFEVKTYVPIT